MPVRLPPKVRLPWAGTSSVYQAMTNLQFADYVNHATVARWQASNLVTRTDSAADSMERGSCVPELVQEEPATTGNQPR